MLFFVAHEPYQTFNLNDVHKNIGIKQLTGPDCIKNIILQHEFLGKLEEI